jgi:hypothetical protein
MIDRRLLVESLEELLSDEYDSSEVVYMTDDEIIMRIIDVAEYYKEQCNS